MSDEGVKLVADHCNTVYMPGNGYGDIGQNIAEFNPGVMGVEDRDDFISQVEQVHERGLTERKSDGLGYLLANNASPPLDEVIQEGVSAQRPEDYADGFVYLCSEDFDLHIITAGIEDIAEESMSQRMNGFTPRVTGTALEQNGNGVEVQRYCAGDEKLRVLRNHYGVESLSDENMVAFGNSDSNDGPMMREAPVGIGRERAYDSADLYVEDDPEFWTRATLAGIASEVLDGDQPHETGRKLAELRPDALEDVEKGGNPGKHADEILDVYEDVRREAV